MRILALALSIMALGCSHTRSSTTAAPREPSVVLRPLDGSPEVRVTVELARTPEEQRVGLMFRKALDPDRGMLFLFDRPQQLSFWMHNCYIPLDMIFVRPDRRVLGVVERAAPMTDDPRSVDGESQFVLEVQSGFAAEHHIEPGTPLTFVDVE